MFLILCCRLNLMLILTVREMWTSLCNFLCNKFFHKPEIGFRRSNGSCDSVYGKRVKLNINIRDASDLLNQTETCSMQEGSVEISDDEEDCYIIAEIPRRKIPGNSVAVNKSYEPSLPAQNSQKRDSWSSFFFHKDLPSTTGQYSETNQIDSVNKGSGKDENCKVISKKFFKTPRILGHKCEKSRLSFKHRLRKKVNFLQESYRLTEKLQYMQLLQSLTSHDLFTLRPSVKCIINSNKQIEVIDLCNEKTSDADKNPEEPKPEDQDIQIVDEISGVRSFQDFLKIKPLNAEIAIQRISSSHHNTSVLSVPKTTINLLNDEDNDTNQKIDTLEEKLRNFMQITASEVQEVENGETYYLPELTPDQERKIRQALIPEPSQEVLSQDFGIHITRQDMQTLVGLNWLNDEIINFYMNLIMERSKLNKKLPKVYAFNTFFYPKLASKGYSSLKRWTKQVDIFSFEIILVPVHLGMHWCLAVIDFRSKSIKYYDSVGSPNNTCLERLLMYLKAESIDKRRMIFHSTDWERSNVEDIPQQMNGGDCGVFSCMFAEHLARDCAILFTQADMPYFRKKMVIEILEKKLLISN